MQIADLHRPFIRDMALMVGQAARDIGGAVFCDVVHQRANRADFTCVARIDGPAFKPIRIFIGDKGRGDIAAFETIMVVNGLQERNVVADAFELEQIQRVLHRVQRDAAIFAPSAELGNHRVVIHGNFAAFKDAGIVPNNGPIVLLPFNRRAVARQAANGGEEITERIFGVNSALNRPAI